MLWALVDFCSCPTSQLLLLLEAGLWPVEMGALVQFGSSGQGEQWPEVGGRERPSEVFIFPFLPTPRSLHPRSGLLRGRHTSPSLLSPQVQPHCRPWAPSGLQIGTAQPVPQSLGDCPPPVIALCPDHLLSSPPRLS